MDELEQKSWEIIELMEENKELKKTVADLRQEVTEQSGTLRERQEGKE